MLTDQRAVTVHVRRSCTATASTPTETTIPTLRQAMDKIEERAALALFVSVELRGSYCAGKMLRCKRKWLVVIWLVSKVKPCSTPGVRRTAEKIIRRASPFPKRESRIATSDYTAMMGRPVNFWGRKLACGVPQMLIICDL
jgi:hypothetical protein